MKLHSLFERNSIWFTAWSLLPVALVINAFAGYDYESSLRWQERAEVEAAVKNWPEAAKWFEAASRASPENPTLAYNASVAHRQLGDLTGARYWLGMSLAADASFQPAIEAQAALDKLIKRKRRRQGRAAP